MTPHRYRMKSNSLILLAASALLVSACLVLPGSQPSPTLTPAVIPPTSGPEISGTVEAGQLSQEVGLTYQNLDGNRLVAGTGTISEADQLRISLPGEAVWLAAVPYQDGSLWTAVIADGSVSTYLVRNGEAASLDFGWEPLPPGTPPLVLVLNDEAALIGPPTSQASALTHPVPVSYDPLRLVFIERGGDLVLWENGVEVDRLAANALPDGRLLVDENGRVLFLSDPTERYNHGVLGDEYEAGSITLLGTDPDFGPINRIEIPSPGVMEGLAPIWVDLDGDGTREILVTVSDADQGARLVLYSEMGEILAQGPAAGQGFRWRHQLAAVPLDGGPELAVFDILRPHLDGLFEAYHWRGDFLTVMDYIPGYSSHNLGSRNLDQTLSGDLDGDGLLEVVVPNQDGTSLSGLFYRGGVMGAAWTLELRGKLTSNLAGAALPDGSLAWGAGVGSELVVYSKR